MVGAHSAQSDWVRTDLTDLSDLLRPERGKESQPEWPTQFVGSVADLKKVKKVALGRLTCSLATGLRRRTGRRVDGDIGRRGSEPFRPVSGEPRRNWDRHSETQWKQMTSSKLAPALPPLAD